jgi:hypothetical protein
MRRLWSRFVHSDTKFPKLHSSKLQSFSYKTELWNSKLSLKLFTLNFKFSKYSTIVWKIWTFRRPVDIINLGAIGNWIIVTIIYWDSIDIVVGRMWKCSALSHPHSHICTFTSALPHLHFHIRTFSPTVQNFEPVHLMLKIADLKKYLKIIENRCLFLIFLIFLILVVPCEIKFLVGLLHMLGWVPITLCSNFTLCINLIK